jgi:hypothetical protein
MNCLTFAILIINGKDCIERTINGSQLNALVEKGLIYKFDNFYSLNDNFALIEERLRGNEQAEKWMTKARWFSRLISWFPYVRGVSLSESLSKGYLGEDPDIDYFMVLLLI